MSNEVKWLGSHKLGAQTVGRHIYMALKAFQQTENIHSRKQIMEVRDVRISGTMEAKPSRAIEIFTELEPMPLPSLQVFASKWTFNISTFTDGTSTKHATRTIVVTATESSTIVRKTRGPLPRVEELGVRKWYHRFSGVGLNFGLDFQGLGRISNPRLRDTLATTFGLKGCHLISGYDQDY